MKKVVFLAAFSALVPLASAQAVVLEQKWTPGQDLNYQTALRGTVNVQTPAGMKFPLAGVPFEIEVKGDGVTQFQTLSVDEAGVGVVALRVPQFDLSASSFGQRGQLQLSETASRFAINGKQVKFGDGTNPLGSAKTALRVSRQGRVIGVQDLDAKPAAQTAPAADDKPVDAAAAINQGALVTAAIINALPTLWPGRDVQIGESWRAKVVFPIASPADKTKITPTQLGEWQLTLKATEFVAGRELQRVAVIGMIKADTSQFMVPSAKIPPVAGKQDVKGDMWLDAAAGQIVRADLVVGASVETGKGLTEPTEQGHADFTGTLKLDLKKAV